MEGGFHGLYTDSTLKIASYRVFTLRENTLVSQP
jgi:hypothetical protein